MADTKISALTDGTPLAAGDQIPVNRGGANRRVSYRQYEEWAIACSDETTLLTTGTAKAAFSLPYAFTVTDVYATVNTAPTGDTLIVDINEEGTTILSTKIVIDVSEFTGGSANTQGTAAAAAVISDTAIAANAQITIDIDQIGSTIAGKGLKVIIFGYRT